MIEPTETERQEQPARQCARVYTRPRPGRRLRNKLMSFWYSQKHGDAAARHRLMKLQSCGLDPKAASEVLELLYVHSLHLNRWMQKNFTGDK